MRFFPAAAVAAISILAVLCVFNVYYGRMVGLQGVSWDFVSHYINAELIANPAFIHAPNSLLLFEPDRAPLSESIMAVLTSLSRASAIPLYVLFLVSLFLVSLAYLARKFAINPVLLFSVAVTPYIIQYPILYNGEEILSLSFVVLALGLMKERRASAGLFLGLAGLSKYMTLVLFPVLLLMKNNTDRLRAIALFLLPMMPWLAFNYLAYGTPFFSYGVAMAASQSTQQTWDLQPGALWDTFGYLIVPALLAVAVWSKELARRLNAGPIALWPGRLLRARYTEFVFLLLPLIEYMAFVPRQYYFDQTRYAYLVYFAAAFIIAVALNLRVTARGKKGRATGRWLTCALFAYSIVALASFYYLSPAIIPNNNAQIQSVVNGIQVLRQYGLENCSVISNSWVTLDYYNISAYSPYALNGELRRYPIIAFNTTTGFNSIGVPERSLDVNGTARVYSRGTVSLYLPKNYTCAAGLLG